MVQRVVMQCVHVQYVLMLFAVYRGLYDFNSTFLYPLHMLHYHTVILFHVHPEMHLFEEEQGVTGTSVALIPHRVNNML